MELDPHVAGCGRDDEADARRIALARVRLRRLTAERSQLALQSAQLSDLGLGLRVAVVDQIGHDGARRVPASRTPRTWRTPVRVRPDRLGSPEDCEAIAVPSPHLR